MFGGIFFSDLGRLLQTSWEMVRTQYVAVFRTGWKALLTVKFSGTALTVSLLWSFPQSADNPLTMLPPKLVPLLEALVWAMIVPALALANQRGTTVNSWVHFKTHFGQVSIETLRAVNRILLGFLMFLIPGFKRSVELYFVSYVTQFDPDYQKGEVDALERSTSLVRGRFWVVFLSMLIWGLFNAVTAIWDDQYLSGLVTGDLSFLWVLPLRLASDVFFELAMFGLYAGLVFSRKSEPKTKG